MGPALYENGPAQNERDVLWVRHPGYKKNSCSMTTGQEINPAHKC